MKRQVVIGLAPGKTADSFGLAVVEVIKTPTPPFGTGLPEFVVVVLKTFPPGADYKPIYARLLRILKKNDVICIVMDQTKVGPPIVRVMSDELGKYIDPVIIGGRQTEHQ